ncbi:MAG: prepilin-type N-terminal cleavage/methylation domain-containing protein [bacterium]
MSVKIAGAPATAWPFTARRCNEEAAKPFLLPRYRVDCRSAGRGLTLVEVLIAVAILSVGSAVLLTATSRCLAVVRASRDYYAARHVMDLVDIEHPILAVKVNGQDQILNATLDNLEYPNGFTASRSIARSETYKDLLIVNTHVYRSTGSSKRGEQATSFLYFTNEVSGP